MGTANCVTLIATVTFGRFLRENRANVERARREKKKVPLQRDKKNYLASLVRTCCIHIRYIRIHTFTLFHFELCFEPICNFCQFNPLREINIYIKVDISKHHSKRGSVIVRYTHNIHVKVSYRREFSDYFYSR